MQESKILNAFSYFSVLFAPFIVPLIIWIIGKDEEVKYHAKRAFISHMISVVLIIIFAIMVMAGALTGLLDNDAGGLTVIIGFIIMLLIYLAIFIWNIVMGIKALL